MDWKGLKEKTSTYIQKVKPYGEKMKIYGDRALEFTQRQLKDTPLILKTVEEYEALLVDTKRLILIGYNESLPLSQEVILRIPVWSTQAWSDAASLRLFALDASRELAMHFGFTDGIEMRVFYEGEETLRVTEVEGIKSWWKNRHYTIKDAPRESATTASLDPQKGTAHYPEKKSIADPLAQNTF